MKHILFRYDWLTGWHYGPHRALEEEIIKQTNAEVISLDERNTIHRIRRIQHGERLDFLRPFIPKKEIKPFEADVAWQVLMNAWENNLDLFKKWHHKVKYRVVYVFDTLFPLQKSIVNALSDDTFNIHITSINEAVPWLEQITGKKWYGIEMAAPEGLFRNLSSTERNIPFVSYGRRLDSFHRVLKEFIQGNNLYYEYTTCNGTKADIFDPYSYNHYAWHLSHAIFNVCWPVELTSPTRAGHLRPITPRWYEAAAAGACVIGRKPGNPLFDEFLDPDLIVDLDPLQDRSAILRNLEKIWMNREQHLKNAINISSRHIHHLTWKNRVERMLELIK